MEPFSVRRRQPDEALQRHWLHSLIVPLKHWDPLGAATPSGRGQAMGLALLTVT